MRLKRFFSNSALGALAATMAMTAFPMEAAAQSRGEERRSEMRQQRQDAGSQVQQRQDRWRPTQAERQPPQQQQPAWRQPQQPQPQPQRSKADRPVTARPVQQANDQRGNGSYLNQARSQARPSGPVEAYEPQPSRSERRDGVTNRYWQGQGAVQVNGQSYGRDNAQAGRPANRTEQGNARSDGNRGDRDQARRSDNDSRSDRNGTAWRRDDDRRGDRDNNRWQGREGDGNRWGRDGNRDGNGWGQDRNRDNDRWRDRNQYRDSWRDGYRDGQRDYRRWDRRWRDDNRYDWHRHRSYNRNVFNIGVYYSPYRNWSYRRLDVGYFLDSLFFSSRYWIDEPWRYRLPDVYGPYRWVRYYDDVLLVDVYSGEVVDVIYDFFW